jgi:hypothetical protein
MPDSAAMGTRRALTAVSWAGAAVAVVVALLGFWLARVYRPGPYVAQVAELSGQAAASRGWSDRHQLSSGVLVMLSALVMGLAVVLSVRADVSARYRWRTVGAAVVALVTSVVTVVTRSMVEFEQVALWAVTVGDNLDGYWFAAFSDEVRFVIVDGYELSPTEYGVTLVVHLVAPILAAAALVAVAVEGRRARGAAPVTEELSAA